MKLTELLQKQNIIVQLLWEEQKIEFSSSVISNVDSTSVYITPYVHNGKELELNVTSDKGVVCNVFADHPVTNNRISWKGVELTTVNRDGSIVYSVSTRSYNAVASVDDRRLNERIPVNIDARLLDEQNGDIGVTIRDISGTGISFYASETYVPKSQQVTVSFTDNIGESVYSVKAECTISRVSKADGHNIIGCKLIGENKDYKVYELLKRLRGKANRGE